MSLLKTVVYKKSCVSAEFFLRHEYIDLAPITAELNAPRPIAIRVPLPVAEVTQAAETTTPVHDDDTIDDTVYVLPPACLARRSSGESKRTTPTPDDTLTPVPQRKMALRSSSHAGNFPSA